MSAKTSNFIRLFLSYTIVGLASVIVLYPVLWIIGASFNPGDSLSSSSMIPKDATLKHYHELFEGDYLLWYWNTLKISITSMVVSLLTVSLIGYAFSRYRFVGRKNSLMMFLVLQMVPGFVAIIAIYVLLNVSGLINYPTLALVLMYVGGGIPMNTWLAKGYFDTIPFSLDESARMDGAGHFRIFWQIILPLSKPILAVVALFSFIGPFTEFILASLVLRSSEDYTLAVGLYNLISKQFGNSFTQFAAGSVLIAIPITILFFLLQKYFVAGLTSGGTKG